MAMSDYVDIIELVNSIFDTVDAKDWKAVEGLLDETVRVDFTSLDGGEAATITGAQLAGAWQQGLHPRKKSFHMIGNHRVTIDGDTASATVKGYAYNALDAEVGGGVWEVWGRYELPLRRTPSGWRAAGITFDAWRSAGDASVRTHQLGSLSSQPLMHPAGGSVREVPGAGRR
jgi:hypothetical protein